MRKILLLLVVLSTIVIKGFGQTTTTTSSSSPEGGNKYSVGLDVGIPVGNAAIIEVLAAGASLKYSYFLSPSFAVTGSIGINSFIVKDTFTGQFGDQQFYTYIPLKVGVKSYLSPNYYLEFQTGGSFYTGSFGSAPLLVLAPGVGYNFGTGIDLAVRYEAWVLPGNTSQVALRFAYSF